MEQKIEDLVASIRREGIDKAREEAESILAEARKKAEGIIADANRERDKMISDAEKAIALERSSAEAAIRQAARDVSLSLKKSIEDEYTRILAVKASGALHGKGLIALIRAALAADAGDKAVELNADDLATLDADIRREFSAEIARGLEFRPSRRVASGFRIAEKDGSGYIDISPDKCQELLYPYLADSLKSII